MRLSEFIKISRKWATEELSEIFRHPQSLVDRLEQVHPKLGKGALSYASEALEPMIMGMGLDIRELSEERLWIVIPSRWKNKNSSGQVALGAYAIAAEFALRLFWSRHLDFQFLQLQLNSLKVILDDFFIDEAWLRFEMKQDEREKFLIQARSQGKAEQEFHLSILSTKEKRIGECVLYASIQTQKVLPGSSLR